MEQQGQQNENTIKIEDINSLLKSQHEGNQFEEQVTLIQKATNLVDQITNVLYKQIMNGRLNILQQKQELPIQRKTSPIKRNLSVQAKLQQVDLDQHRKKVKQFMSINRKCRQRLNNRTIQFQKSLKKQEQYDKLRKQQVRDKQIDERKRQISLRLTSKAQLMSTIKKLSLQADQKVSQVKSKKFLYQQKQQMFKSKFILPKIQEQKRILERRKDRMKSIDMNELLQHEKIYEKKKKENKINRSMTSRLIKFQTEYHPPEFVPTSYMIYQTQQTLKKQSEILQEKQIKIYKEQQKQFVKKISSLHKLQRQMSVSRSISPQLNQKERENIKKQQKEKKKKAKKNRAKQISKQQVINIGNQYFKQLMEQIKKVKERKQKKAKQVEQAKIKEENEKQNDSIEDLQIQIKSQQIKTVQKIQKIERIHKIRSRKIQKIFSDQKLHPLVKYQKLKHQVEKFDFLLKSKNCQSDDIKERSQAAGCYLDAIKAKIKLLESATPKTLLI